MAGEIIYLGSTGITANVAGSSGQVLISGGTGAPTWINNGSTVYFKAYFASTSSNVTGDGTQLNPIIFPSTAVNIGSGYNTGTGIFTVPSSGTYQFGCQIMFSGLATNHTDLLLALVNSTSAVYAMDIFINPATNNDVPQDRLTINGSGIIVCTAADQVKCFVRVAGGSKTVDFVGSADQHCNFWGMRIGA